MGFELKHVGGPKWLAVDEDGVTVHEFKGKKATVIPEFEAWLADREGLIEDPVVEGEVVEPVVDDGEREEVEVVEPVLPDPAELRGLAKTAALNAQTDSTFIEGEWVLKSGVHNEANHVYNVPDGWQAAWATPVHIDGGRHANYIRERGYRPVYKDEMGSDMYSSELYVAYMDSDDSEFVYMSGAQLFIGPSQRLAKIRRAEYDAHMAAFNSKQEEDQEFAESIGGSLRTQRESSVYNPMRS